MLCNSPGSLCGPRPRVEREQKSNRKLDDARSRSILATATDSASFDSLQGEYVFETTKIKIQLLGLVNGIIMEATGREENRIRKNKSDLVGSEPVFAVVTGFNELPGGKNIVVATHVPSLPIEKQTVSNKKKHLLMAMWPTDFDPHGTQTSTVTFTRKVRKTPIQSLSSVQTNETKTCVYTTESLVLAISLMRGKEMITVGAVTVYFTGEESNSVQINLPIKNTKYAVKKAVKQMKGKQLKKKHYINKIQPMKPVSFKADRTRTYRLDEDATLSILLETSKVTEQLEDIMENNPSRCDIIVTDDQDREEVATTITQKDILLDLAMTSEYLDNDNDSESDTSADIPFDEMSLGDESWTKLTDRYEINIDASTRDILATSGKFPALKIDTSHTTDKKEQVFTPKASTRKRSLASSLRSSKSASDAQVSEYNADGDYIVRPHTVKYAKPGDLPPASSFSPLSWMPTPKEMAKKFGFVVKSDESEV